MSTMTLLFIMAGSALYGAFLATLALRPDLWEIEEDDSAQLALEVDSE